jgi:hypothetical protein
MNRMNLGGRVGGCFGDRMGGESFQGLVRLEVRHVWTCLLCALLLLSQAETRERTQKVERWSIAGRRNLLSFLVAGCSKNVDPNKLPVKPRCLEVERGKFRKKVTWEREGGGRSQVGW